MDSFTGRCQVHSLSGRLEESQVVNNFESYMNDAKPALLFNTVIRPLSCLEAAL